jgi:polysaccharide export outer membrane protein
MINDVKTNGILRRILPVAATATLTIAGLASTGCETDDYLNPSSTGRFEHTPTIMPILKKIAAIEPDDSEYVQITEVQPEDLRPLVTEYRLVPGDTLEITISNYPAQGVTSPFPVRVENNGTVNLPTIGKFYILGATGDEVQSIVADGLIKQDLIRRPELSVLITGRSEQQFSIMGSVRAPGPYFIPQPSYRLLDALAASGGLADARVAELFIIRQIPLSDEYSDIGAPGGSSPIDPNTGNINNDSQDDGSSDRLLELIDELSEPASPAIRAPQGTALSWNQPEDDALEPEVDLVQPGDNGDGQQLSPFDHTSSQWIFIDGRWVQIKDRSTNLASGLRERADDAISMENLVTQRIIKIETEPLMMGDARKNVVIRPGDIIRVPTPSGGTVYLEGQVNRPGAFDIAPGLTLTRLIASAGGLGGLAIPERVDIVRMIGTDRQATIRVNYRAIAEQSQPDLFIKANDRVVIGTNFWAYPLAVVRGGFRASYGFGFLLDRNFGTDVFGAPPTNNRF